MSTTEEVSPYAVLLDRLKQTVLDHERHGWGTQSGCETGLRMVLHGGLPKHYQKRLCLDMDKWMDRTGRTATHQR